VGDRAAGWLLLLSVAFLVALPGLIALSVDSQIMSMLILGGHLVGRPVTLPQAVRHARARFWPVLRASFLVGTPTTILNALVGRILEPYLGVNSEGPALLASAVTTFIMLPFVYVASAVIVGEVGAIEAAKRSIVLQRARWQLAVLIALFGAAIGYITFFALLSGGDILGRVGTTLGLGFDRGLPGVIATIVVIVAAIVALGSLTFTVTALASAPQVVAFLALTNYAGGIERARATPAVPDEAGRALPAPGWTTTPAPRFRWISGPMLVSMMTGALIAIVGLIDVANA